MFNTKVLLIIGIIAAAITATAVTTTVLAQSSGPPAISRDAVGYQGVHPCGVEMDPTDCPMYGGTGNTTGARPGNRGPSWGMMGGTAGGGMMGGGMMGSGIMGSGGMMGGGMMGRW